MKEDDESIDLLDIEFGFNGKPYLVVVNENEPYKKYLAILDKTAGPGNYNFTLPSGEESEEVADLESYDEIFSNPPYVFLKPRKFDEVEKIIAANEFALKDVNPDKSSYAPTIVIGYYQTIFFYYIVTKQLLKAKSILYQLKINGTDQTVYDSFYNLFLQSVDIFLEEIATELQNGDE